MANTAMKGLPRFNGTYPSDYLFGRTIRIVSGCLAIVVALSQIVVLTLEDVICYGQYAYWRDFSELLHEGRIFFLSDQSEWQVMPGFNLATAILKAVPIAFLGSLGFSLAFLAKKAWCYPRFIILAGCAIGFVLVPLLGLRETIRTFERFGDM